jgi:hypothetical protein
MIHCKWKSIFKTPACKDIRNKTSVSLWGGPPSERFSRGTCASPLDRACSHHKFYFVCVTSARVTEHVHDPALHFARYPGWVVRKSGPFRTELHTLCIWITTQQTITETRRSTWLTKNNKLEHSFPLEFRTAWNLICHPRIVSGTRSFSSLWAHEMDCHSWFWLASANMSPFCGRTEKKNKGTDEGPTKRVQQWSLASRKMRTSLATRILTHHARDLRAAAYALWWDD